MRVWYAVQVSHQLWFEVLAAYVSMLRKARSEEQKLARPSTPKVGLGMDSVNSGARQTSTN